MANLEITDYKKFLSSDMITDYRNELIQTIKSSYPDIDEASLKKLINREIKKNIKEEPIVEFNNNYRSTRKKVTLTTWYSWYKKKKPITTEHGVCFKRHDEAINLSAKLLEYILDTRKYHKKLMFECKKAGDSIGEAFHNIRQKVFKIFANSYYGATGQNKSVFYNLYTALSITGKGQSLITNAATSFEQFFADNIGFNNLDDLMIYIKNIKNDKRVYKDSTCLSKQISKEKLVKRLLSKFYDKKEALKYKEEIIKIVDGLSKKDINRIYYKNNLYEFCKCPKVLNKVYYIIDNAKSFKDPNEIPEEIRDDLNELWLWLKEFVYYPHTLFNHITICKNMTRKCVVTVDTDSNMLNIEPWIDFLIRHSDKKYKKTTIDDETIFKMVNIMAYILGHMIGEVHERYTDECGVPEEKRPIINMKNEFLMKRMVLTNSKKNYASILLLQEGANVAEEDSLDIKGLTIKKSNVNKNVGNEMQNILESDILRSKKINISNILSELDDLQYKIKKSLLNGELYYTKPDKSNEPSTYKTPFQIQAVRGIYAWNCLYPDKEITYPAQVNMVKLKCSTLFDLDNFMKMVDSNVLSQKENDNIYNIIEEKIFHNDNFSKYGFTVIAIPKTEDKIPEWLIPFIDVDTMIFDSLTNFNKIIGSISVKTINTNANSEHFSNIIDF